MHLFSFPPDFTTLISKWRKNVLESIKRTFERSSFSALPSQDALENVAVLGVAWYVFNPSLSPLPVMLSQLLELTLHNNTKGCSFLCTFFLPYFFHASQLPINMLQCSSLQAASLFSTGLLWLTHFVEGVCDNDLDNWQQSSLWLLL